MCILLIGLQDLPLWPSVIRKEALNAAHYKLMERNTCKQARMSIWSNPTNLELEWLQSFGHSHNRCPPPVSPVQADGESSALKMGQTVRLLQQID